MNDGAVNLLLHFAADSPEFNELLKPWPTPFYDQLMKERRTIMSKELLSSTTFRDGPRGMTKVDWPDPASVVISSNHATYQTPDGVMHGTTRVLKVLGLSTENLIRWAAGVEKSAALEACSGLWSSASAFETGQDFAKAVEAAMGTARQHQKQMQKAADIGTAVHAAVHDYLRGRDIIDLQAPAYTAFNAFLSWWKESGLKAVRMEQPVWDKADGYAGTIDLIAEHPENGLGILDWKTSKGIYDDHHLQVAAYLHAARNFADVKWAQIVRLPKTASDPGFEVKELGSMYGRDLTPERLLEAFHGALAAYRVLLAKP